jgi:hypothetical protein
MNLKFDMMISPILTTCIKKGFKKNNGTDKDGNSEVIPYTTKTTIPINLNFCFICFITNIYTKLDFK